MIMVLIVYAYPKINLSFVASDDFYHLLITLANKLDPDQDRQSVGPDLDPNSRDTMRVLTLLHSEWQKLWSFTFTHCYPIKLDLLSYFLLANMPVLT